MHEPAGCCLRDMWLDKEKMKPLTTLVHAGQIMTTASTVRQQVAGLVAFPGDKQAYLGTPIRVELRAD